MLQQFFLWCSGRLEATKRENQRKIAIGQCAAHAMVMYLYGLPITTINVTGKTEDICLLRTPVDIDDLMLFTRALVLARAAERAVLKIADELLNGRRFLDKRLPDRNLISVCDGNGNILGSDEIVAHMKQVSNNITAMDAVPIEVQSTFANLAEYRAYFFDILAKRIISHHYLAIVNLGEALAKQPIVAGEQACRELFEDCVRRASLNPLKLYCPCHTDPVKSDFKKAIAKRARSH